MTFKTKIRKIGNSIGIYIPKNVITGLKVGDEIELERVITSKPNVITSDKTSTNVITSKENVITSEPALKNTKPVITSAPKTATKQHKVKFNTEWCTKHKVYKGTCGCK